MKQVILVPLLALLWAIPTAAADTSDVEIEHLLSFVERSGCSFIRNGKTYTAVKARQHIAKKYDYLKNRIKSAEQFITYTASKSSMTGESYSVICGAETLSSKEWLETELREYRQLRDRAEEAGGAAQN